MLSSDQKSNAKGSNANNNTDNDHLLPQFLSVTGSSNTTIAHQYLEMSGNNLQKAVGLFLEHGAGGMGGVGGSSKRSALAAAGPTFHHFSKTHAWDKQRP